MEAKLGKAGKQAFRIANLLDDAADALRKRSKRAYREGRISLEEYMEARAKELELRAEVSVVMASDLSRVLGDADAEGEKIEQAIRDAKAQTATMRSLDKALKIVAALIRLAGALASGNVKSVLEASKGAAEVR